MYGSDDLTGSIEVENTLLTSLIVTDLDYILKQNDPNDFTLGLKYNTCHENHASNSLWYMYSIFERGKKYKYVRANKQYASKYLSFLITQHFENTK